MPTDTVKASAELSWGGTHQSFDVAAAAGARSAGGSSISNSSARASSSSNSSRPSPGNSTSHPAAAAGTVQPQRAGSKDSWGSVPTVMSPVSATAKSCPLPAASASIAAKQQLAQSAASGRAGEIVDEPSSGYQGTATASAAASAAPRGKNLGLSAVATNQRQNSTNSVAETSAAAAAGSAASRGRHSSNSGSSSKGPASRNQDEPAPTAPGHIRSAGAAAEDAKVSVQPADLDAVRPVAAAADCPAASKPRTDPVVLASCLPEDEDDLLGISSSSNNCSKIKPTLNESSSQQQQQQRTAVKLGAVADLDGSQQHGQKGSSYTSQQQQQKQKHKQQGLLSTQPPPPPRKADGSHDGSNSSNATVFFGVSGSSGMRSAPVLQYSTSMSPPLPQPAHRMVLSPTGMAPVWTAYSTGLIDPAATAAAAAVGVAHPMGMPLPPTGTLANHTRQVVGSPAPVMPGVMLSPTLQHSPQMQHMQQQQFGGAPACGVLVKPAPSKRLAIVDPRSRHGSNGQLNGQTVETAGNADVSKDSSEISRAQISRDQISNVPGSRGARSACGEAAVASTLLQV